jgi:hypothetical protein
VNDYSYETSGFDSFLSRSIDNLSQATLDSNGPSNTAFAYDRAQISGALGDTFNIGNIKFDGKAGVISVGDWLKIGSLETGNGLALYETNGNLILDIVQDEKGRARLGITDSSNKKRLVAGRFPDGNVKMKLSQDTYEVDTAEDDKLIWSSDFNSFKIVGTGVATVGAALAGGTNFTTVSHNLGYVPIVLAHLNGPDSSPLPIILPDVSTGNIFGAITIEFLSTTSFQFWSYASTGSGGLPSNTIKYYLLRETAI